MRVTCPSCTSGYDVDPARIGPGGRTLRCASCRNSWYVAGPNEAADPADITLSVETVSPEPTAPVLARDFRSANVPIAPTIVARKPRPKTAKRRPAKRARKRSGAAPKRWTAAALAIALTLALPGLALGRHAVVGLLPGTASLFAALGLPVNLVGLTFADVSSALIQEAEGPVLAVEGSVRNATGRKMVVPPLEIAIAGPRGEALYAWSVQAIDSGEIGPGATMPFTVRLASPPTAGSRVEVAFRDRNVSRVASR